MILWVARDRFKKRPARSPMIVSAQKLTAEDAPPHDSAVFWATPDGVEVLAPGCTFAKNLIRGLKLKPGEGPVKIRVERVE